MSTLAKSKKDDGEIIVKEFFSHGVGQAMLHMPDAVCKRYAISVPTLDNKRIKALQNLSFLFRYFTTEESSPEKRKCAEAVFSGFEIDGGEFNYHQAVALIASARQIVGELFEPASESNKPVQLGKARAIAMCEHISGTQSEYFDTPNPIQSYIMRQIRQLAEKKIRYKFKESPSGLLPSPKKETMPLSDLLSKLKTNTALEKTPRRR